MGLYGKISQRFRGFETIGDWRIYRITDDDRASANLPARIPVPKTAWDEWHDGKDKRRLEHQKITEYTTRFSAEYPEHELTAEVAGFVRKAPLATAVEAALAEQNWQEADDLLSKVLELDGSDHRALLLRAYCLQNQDQLEAADAVYEQLGDALGDDPDYFAFRGVLYEKRGDIERAKALYAEALERREDHPVALDRLAGMGEMVEIWLGDLDNPERAYVPREAYEEAIVTGWEKEPGTIEFLLDRAKFHLQNGQPRLSLEAADKALAILDDPELNPVDQPALALDQRPTILAARCKALIADEAFDEAKVVVDHLTQIAPESESTYSCRGQLLWFSGEPNKGVEWITKSIALNPNRIENLYLYLKPEFPREYDDPYLALQALDNEHPESWAVKSLMGLVLMASEKWDDALPIACEAARLGAADEILLELTGRLGRADRNGDVIQVVESAGGWRKLAGRDPMLQFNIGASMLRTGDRKAAGELWQGVIDSAGAHPEVRLRARAALKQLETEDSAVD
jgi:tetratricopeptide (TPR) repeat protein